MFNYIPNDIRNTGGAKTHLGINTPAEKLWGSRHISRPYGPRASNPGVGRELWAKQRLVKRTSKRRKWFHWGFIVYALFEAKQSCKFSRQFYLLTSWRTWVNHVTSPRLSYILRKMEAVILGSILSQPPRALQRNALDFTSVFCISETFIFLSSILKLDDSALPG